MSTRRAGVLAAGLLFLLAGASSTASARTPSLSRLILTAHDLATAIPARSLGGNQWTRALLPLRPLSTETGRINAFFVPNTGRHPAADVIQVIAVYKSAQKARSAVRVWYETRQTVLSRPHSALSPIKHMGQQAGIFQLGTGYYEVYFVDRSLVEELLFAAHRKDRSHISRAAVLRLAWQAYRLEHRAAH